MTPAPSRSTSPASPTTGERPSAPSATRSTRTFPTDTASRWGSDDRLGIPLEEYPDTYNGQPLGIAALASQKNHMSIYLMGLYASEPEERWFRDEYAKRGLKLDMGKSCVRFKRLEQVPLDVIGQVIAKVTPELYIERYEASRAHSRSGR